MQEWFVNVVIPAISFFSNFKLYAHNVNLILINRCLLKVFFIMKVLNGQNFSKQNFQFPYLPILYGEPGSIYASFTIFSLLFYFKLYKISTDPTQVVISWLAS